MKLYTYNQRSKTARALADNLGIKILKRNSKYDFNKDNHLILNYGMSSPLERYANYINHPLPVKIASNKLSFFESFTSEGHIPEWTTDQDEANDWLSNGDRIVCRKTLNGHSGEGIHLQTEGRITEDYPLYVKAYKKEKEYRIHVGKWGSFKMVLIYRKRLKHDANIHNPNRNNFVRSHANGWVYVAEPDAPGMESFANHTLMDYLGSINLAFGAFDIIVTPDGTVLVLECNTAPGLVESSLNAYTQFFTDINNYWTTP